MWGAVGRMAARGTPICGAGGGTPLYGAGGGSQAPPVYGAGGGTPAPPVYGAGGDTPVYGAGGGSPAPPIYGAGGPGRPLEGKVAVVTAATQGIGLAVAAGLAEAGARVVLSSRRQPHVEAAVGQLRRRGLEVSGVVCHVGQPHSREGLVRKALETYGGIDILVSNAGVNPHLGSALQAGEGVWEKIFQVNVTAAAMLVQLVVPHMEKRGGGSIVLVSSLAAFRPFPALGPYSVSKAALVGLVKVLAPELLPRNIRVNAVAPGLVQTRFSAALWEEEATRQQMMEGLGIQRLGTPRDVAGAVTFLCSPAASYVVGETLVVAGGAPSRL